MALDGDIDQAKTEVQQLQEAGVLSEEKANSLISLSISVREICSSNVNLFSITWPGFVNSNELCASINVQAAAYCL